MTILEVTGIGKAYGGIHALADCSMAFSEGAINGLIGPNGSGKTTLFNVMTGYTRPDAGRVLLRGEDVTGARPDQVFRRGVARTFQLTRIFPRLSVIENVHVASRREGLLAHLRRWTTAAEHEQAQEALDFVGLSRLANEPAGSLSYGQQKLLEFAFILVTKPQVMLLDEPAGGVNPALLRQLADRIRALNREGVTFIIVEHDMEFVMGLCDRVLVMQHGRALTDGTPAAVRRNPAVLEAYLGTDMREAG
jgi:neutral amino acid transport system ATP-binding protein